MAQHHILVVEDEPVSLQSVVDCLIHAGFGVEAAADGREALNKLKNLPHKFSAIVLDRVMPFMGGMELMQHIKKDSQLKEIPVIMLTALDEHDDIADAVEAGVFDYLTKPIDPPILIELLQEAINKRA
ncbi:MAG: hypothetical protein A3C55_05850 [Gammaproteobacteria bacterium RIFCSPHIGHO2_02_FULL_42_13]|nr:MAG: hypothetical protein A3C55_05850 [Gammaproteobacteria bacterium RIFCSPHIGHO2_02_FULL_42_13]